MRINSYSPDTCNCKIYYSIDEETNEISPFVQPEIPIFGRVIDLVATELAEKQWQTERDAAHLEIATAAGVTVEQLRQQASQLGIQLPYDSSKPAPIMSSVLQQVDTRKSEQRICERHAHLLMDPAAWHAAVFTDNQKKNTAVNSLTEAGVPFEDISFSIDKTGKLSLEVAATQDVDVTQVLKDAGHADVEVTEK